MSSIRLHLPWQPGALLTALATEHSPRLPVEHMSPNAHATAASSTVSG